MIIRFKAYNRYSRGLSRLRAALDRLGHRVYAYDRNFNLTSSPRINNDLIINWGSSMSFDLLRQNNRAPLAHSMLNEHTLVRRAANKLEAFQILNERGVITVPFTTDINQAYEWHEAGFNVMERHVLNGHSGEGIVVKHPLQGLDQAPLYTRYTKKKEEYRVHVFAGEVIDIQQKRIRRDQDRINEIPAGLNYAVRNHQNGWVYCRENLSLSVNNREVISELAIAAINALGLDFGAVDIIYNERQNQFYVLEVNTAVGIEGTTAEIYARAIDNLIRAAIIRAAD